MSFQVKAVLRSEILTFSFIHMSIYVDPFQELLSNLFYYFN